MAPRIVLLILLCWSAPAVAQDLVVPSDRVTSFVRVRSAPSADAMEVGRLDVGESARLLDSVPRWFEIQLPDGPRGFVSKVVDDPLPGTRAKEEDELRIHFLNIGTGSCTVVECPGSGAPPMIVDCGSTGAAPDDLDAAETRTAVQAILSQHTAPPNVVLSHADQDHYSHIARALDTIQVAPVWQGGSPADYTSNNFPAWLATQEKGGAELHRDFPKNWHNDGAAVADLSCGDATTFVLTVSTGANKNTQSLVLFIEYEDFSVIFSGDAEWETEAQARGRTT